MQCYGMQGLEFHMCTYTLRTWEEYEQPICCIVHACIHFGEVACGSVLHLLCVCSELTESKRTMLAACACCASQVP